MKKDEDQVTGIKSKTKKLEICKMWAVRLNVLMVLVLSK